jgi:serine/threonine protein kinase
MISIDGYADLERIGQGGLGDVYRATRLSTGGTVAIKVLRDVSDQSVTWHRTRRELTALVALAGHAHVIQLLELIDHQPTAAAEHAAPALVMEYAPGGSVAELLNSRPDGVTPAEVVLIGRHTASALAAAHAQGIVHRDVKPQNLLIDGYGQIKLCDFGVAALTRSEEFQVQTNALSMRYASPEDLDDDADVSSPADVYSLGATLLHLVHGAPPTLKERLAPWTPPEGSDDGAGGALDAVLAACLHPTPSVRPTAEALLAQLDDLDRSLDDRVRALPVVVDSAPRPEPTPLRAPAGDLDDPGADRTDATLYRQGRSPRPSSVAVTRPSERRVPFVAIGMIVVLVVGAVVGWIWWNDSEGVAVPAPTAAPSASVSPDASPVMPTGEPGVRVVERPQGLVPVADLVWPFGDPGECLVQVDGASELQPVDCSQPHDLQRYAVATLGEPDVGPDEPFDIETVRAAVASGCEAAYEPFTGESFVDRRFDTPFTAPSAATWPSGDRRYQCFVGVEDARLVGDATGSG